MRRGLCAALLAALLLAVASCGGGATRRAAPGAHVEITLRADGGGRVNFWVGGGMRTDRELRELGGRVAEALFPGTAVRRTTVEPGTAFPYARTDVPLAFVRGSRPTFRIAGDHVDPVLRAAGFSGYTLLVRPPAVPTTVDSRTRPSGTAYAWKVSPGVVPPTAVIVMRPRPLHWVAAMALLAAAVAATVVAFAAVRRWVAAAGCAVAVGTAPVLVAAHASGESLGVHGYLGGAPLTAAILAPLAAVPLALAAAVRLLVVIARPRARPVISLYHAPGDRR